MQLTDPDVTGFNACFLHGCSGGPLRHVVAHKLDGTCLEGLRRGRPKLLSSHQDRLALEMGPCVKDLL